MILPRRGPAFFKRASAPASLVLLAAFMALAAYAADANGSAPNPEIAQYRSHLADLQTLVAACQKQRTPEACDPAQVGPNDSVPWPPAVAAAPEREIRYDWLRALLLEAGKTKPAKAAPNKTSAAKNQAAPPLPLGVPAPVVKVAAPTIDALLTEARQRLAGDAAQAIQTPQPAPGYAAQRRALTAILAQRQYQGVTQTTVRERFLEWLGNALDEIFGKLMGIGARSPWIGFVLRGLLLAGLCLALVWALVRIERRSRIRLVADAPGFPAAPSARNWQLWLRDAHAMEAQGLWREAIHFLYWAAIAHLESRHLWPDDRARTPREYLRLLPASDPRRAGLTALTRTFERTWYGGREAGSADYRSAMERAAELGVE